MGDPLLPERYTIPAGRVARGAVAVPGSKSMTQRYLNLALIGRQPLVVHRPLLSEDPRLFVKAMAATGFTTVIDVDATPPAIRLMPGEVPASGTVLCGNGGTMFRFLTAALTTVPGTWRLDGVPRLRERPVTPLVRALRRLGAKIDCPEREGHAPLVIHGGTLIGGITELDAGASSQYLSALLMASLAATRPTEVVVRELTSAPYVELTLAAIQDFGGVVEVDQDGQGRRVDRVVPMAGPMEVDQMTVEADFSAAAYPAAAAALTGGPVRIGGLRRDSRQGDRQFLALLERMGALVHWEGNEPVVSAGSRLTAVDVDLSSMPDQVPTLAALAPFAHGTTRIRNVAHLRIKESDRLLAMSSELRRLGAEVVEHDDGLEIAGCWAKAAPPSSSVVVESHGDHRIAMAMALVGLRRPGVTVDSPAVVGKSYPDFWTDLEQLIAE